MKFVIKLKNFSNIEQPGIIINDTITSRHDTDRLSEIFLLLKNNFRKKYGT